MVATHNVTYIVQKKPELSVISLLGIQSSIAFHRDTFLKNMIWSLFYCKCFCKQPSRVLHHVLFWVHLLSCFRYSYVILNHEMKHRSSRVELFCRLDVLKSFAKFVGKHLSWSFFWTKFQAWRPITLFKIDSSAGVFLWILYKV